MAALNTATAKGDLSRKITVEAKGEILELKNTINTMVDQLNSLSSEVTRVALEVIQKESVGGQEKVPGVADVSIAVANGDLSKKITVDVRGVILELKETINIMVDQLRGFSSDVTRVPREVGTDGNLGGQAFVLALPEPGNI